MPRTICRIIFAGLALASLALKSFASNEVDDPWIRGTYTALSPRMVSGRGNPQRIAAEVAARYTDRFVIPESFWSMNPLYPERTVVVFRRIEYAALKCGQTALYKTNDGRTVAHVLVTKARDGWRAQGLSNPNHDMEPVTEKNLLGVAFEAFSDDH